MRSIVRLVCVASALLLGGLAAAEEPQGSCQESPCPLKQAVQPQAGEQAQGGQADKQAGEQAQAGTGAPGERQLEGNVSHVAALVQDFRVVDPETGRILTLDVEKSTEISRGGEKIDLEQIREGAEVRVSYALRGDEYVAARVEVSDKPAEPAELVEEARPGQSPLLAVEGRVTDKSDFNKDFKIVDPERQLAVTVDDSERTLYLLDGRKVAFESVAPGLQVRATYRADKRGELVAQRVELTGDSPLLKKPGEQPAMQPPIGPPTPPQPSAPQPSVPPAEGEQQ